MNWQVNHNVRRKPFAAKNPPLKDYSSSATNMETVAKHFGMPTSKKSEDSCASSQTKSLRSYQSNQGEILQSRPLSTTVNMMGQVGNDGAHNAIGEACSILNQLEDYEMAKDGQCVDY